MSNNRLAIIIPAYKSSFLRETLDSILNQSCQDFNLYIGDDASPFDLKTIVNEYELKIPLNYKRFDNNLGGKDLVSQWERCIELTENEEWIWLFSDDDIMSKNCVKEFYNIIDSGILNISEKVLRFNRHIINEKLETIPCDFEMPREYDIKYLMQIQNEGKHGSNLTEHIFSRKLYTEMGGYVNFPLGWGSDGITFMKYGEKYGFVTIPENVYWRSSGENLSTQKMFNIKIQSEILINKWLYIFLEKYKNDGKIYKGQIKLRFNTLIHYLDLPLHDLLLYTNSLYSELKISKIRIYWFIASELSFLKVKHEIKKLIKEHFPIFFEKLIRLKVWK